MPFFIENGIVDSSKSNAVGRLQVSEKPVQVLKLRRIRAFQRADADGFALRARRRGDSR